jgi:hypothetical protein
VITRREWAQITAGLSAMYGVKMTGMCEVIRPDGTIDKAPILIPREVVEGFLSKFVEPDTNNPEAK